MKRGLGAVELMGSASDTSVYQMKTVTVRDLSYNFPKVERMLREGQALRVTKWGKVIARLEADGPDVVAVRQARLFDSMAKLKELYGDSILEPSSAELISAERDERP